MDVISEVLDMIGDILELIVTESVKRKKRKESVKKKKIDMKQLKREEQEKQCITK